MYKYCCDRCKLEVNKCDKCQNLFELHEMFYFKIASYYVDSFALCINSADGKSYKQNIESFKLCRECWMNAEKKHGEIKLEYMGD
jgi:hypothetical protein